MNIIVFPTFSVTETMCFLYSPGHYVYVSALNKNTFRNESFGLNSIGT